MKRLIFKICLLVGILAVVDSAAGYLLDSLRDHSPDGRYFKTGYTLNRCREDVVIIGSSRGEQNFIPKIFEDSLGLSCWNASRGGQGMPYFRAIQEGILARYTPKVVILNVDEMELESAPDYEIAGILRPYYHSCPSIREVLNRSSPFEWLLMRSRLYEYNSSFYYLFRPYLIHDLDGKTSDKGWKQHYGKINAGLITNLEIERDTDLLDEESLALIETFIKKFRERGVQLILVVSPNFGRTAESLLTIKYLREKSLKDDIPLFVYSSDTTFITQPDYFADPNHLNETGARIFTKDLVHKIKQEILPENMITLNKNSR